MTIQGENFFVVWQATREKEFLAVEKRVNTCVLCEQGEGWIDFKITHEIIVDRLAGYTIHEKLDSRFDYSLRI